MSTEFQQSPIRTDSTRLSRRPHTAIQDTKDTMQTAESKTLRSWQEIAREVTQEQDPAKVRKLSAELNQAMLDEERRKVRLRLGCWAAEY